MRERTLTIGSAGKTFSVTGWKVGWVVGPRDIVAALHASRTGPRPPIIPTTTPPPYAHPPHPFDPPPPPLGRGAGYTS